MKTIYVNRARCEYSNGKKFGSIARGDCVIYFYENGDVHLKAPTSIMNRKRLISNVEIAAIKIDSFRGTRLTIWETDGTVSVYRVLRNIGKLKAPASALIPLLSAVYGGRVTSD